jgi:hypothetical protein
VKKEPERLNKIRGYLLEHKKATWTEISTATRIQPKELCGDLRKLLDKREVVCEQDTKDRRKTWYELSNERRSNAEVERFKTIEFLLNLKNPEFDEQSFEQTKGKIKFHGRAAFVFEEPKFPKGVNEVIGHLDLKPFENAFKFTDKVAVIITLERNKAL